MLVVVTPSGLEEFFQEVHRAAGDGDGEEEAPTPEDIGPKYGIEIRLPPS